MNQKRCSGACCVPRTQIIPIPSGCNIGSLKQKLWRNVCAGSLLVIHVPKAECKIVCLVVCHPVEYGAFKGKMFERIFSSHKWSSNSMHKLLSREMMERLSTISFT